MAVTWDLFFPYVQPHVPGCPEIVIEAHLRESAAEYCAISEIWRFDIDKDFTSKSTSDYEIDVPSGAAVENILSLFIDGVACSRVSDRLFDLPSGASNARPTSYSLYQDAQVRLFPTPDGKYSFEGTAVLKPSLSASGVEDFIFESHGRAIANGALYRLTAIPGKEWTHPELASYYRAEFYRQAHNAKGRDTRRVNMRVRPQGFDAATKRRGM